MKYQETQASRCLSGSAHRMHNEMHIWLKCLCRLVQWSLFFLIPDQKNLSLIEMGEQGKMLSSSVTDELHLVAHPVGSVSHLVIQAHQQFVLKILIRPRSSFLTPIYSSTLS